MSNASTFAVQKRQKRDNAIVQHPMGLQMRIQMPIFCRRAILTHKVVGQIAKFGLKELESFIYRVTCNCKIILQRAATAMIALQTQYTAYPSVRHTHSGIV